MKQRQQTTPLVAVHCMVFNHGPYVGDALRGFVNQKTTFPFVVIVHDDCSSDNSVEVIKQYASQYPKIIKPIFETENQYSKGMIHKIMNDAIRATGAKYTAMCEGDDYWIDDFKLQKQVDFMEANPSYGLCCGLAKVYNQQKHCFTGFIGTPKCEQIQSIIQNYNDVVTATSMFRTSLCDDYYDFATKNLPQEMHFDTAMWYWFAQNSKIKYFDEVWSVYRVLPESASHTKDSQQLLEMDLKFLKLKLYFLSYFPLQNPKDNSAVVNALLDEIRGIGLQYATIKENQIRSSKTYRTGKKIANIFKKLDVI